MFRNSLIQFLMVTVSSMFIVLALDSVYESQLPLDISSQSG